MKSIGKGLIFSQCTFQPKEVRDIYLDKGSDQMLVEVDVDLVLVHVGQQPGDGVEHEHEHQQNHVLK